VDKEQSIQLEEEEGCCDPDMAELLRMEDEEEHRLANEAHANAYLPDKLEHDEDTNLPPYRSNIPPPGITKSFKHHHMSTAAQYCLS
jgi:hypothetical protein